MDWWQVIIVWGVAMYALHQIEKIKENQRLLKKILSILRQPGVIK